MRAILRTVREAGAILRCPGLVEFGLLEQPSVLCRGLQPKDFPVGSDSIDVSGADGTALLPDLDVGSTKERPVGDLSQVHGDGRPFGVEVDVLVDLLVVLSLTKVGPIFCRKSLLLILLPTVRSAEFP